MFEDNLDNILSTCGLKTYAKNDNKKVSPRGKRLGEKSKMRYSLPMNQVDLFIKNQEIGCCFDVADVLTTEQYQKTCLLQKCVVCGNSDYVLRFLFRGDIRDCANWVPLCKRHDFKFNLILTEFNLFPGFDLLCCLGRNNKCEYNRNLLPYRKFLLKYRTEMLGLKCQWKPYAIGNKKSKKHDKKTIIIQRKEYYFDIKTGKIQIGYNGKLVNFEKFCNNLNSYLI